MMIFILQVAVEVQWARRVQVLWINYEPTNPTRPAIVIIVLVVIIVVVFILIIVFHSDSEYSQVSSPSENWVDLDQVPDWLDWPSAQYWAV